MAVTRVNSELKSADELTVCETVHDPRLTRMNRFMAVGSSTWRSVGNFFTASLLADGVYKACNKDHLSPEGNALLAIQLILGACSLGWFGYKMLDLCSSKIQKKQDAADKDKLLGRVAAGQTELARANADHAEALKKNDAKHQQTIVAKDRELLAKDKEIQALKEALASGELKMRDEHYATVLKLSETHAGTVLKLTETHASEKLKLNEVSSQQLAQIRERALLGLNNYASRLGLITPIVHYGMNIQKLLSDIEKERVSKKGEKKRDVETRCEKLQLAIQKISSTPDYLPIDSRQSTGIKSRKTKTNENLSDAIAILQLEIAALENSLKEDEVIFTKLKKETVEMLEFIDRYEKVIKEEAEIKFNFPIQPAINPAATIPAGTVPIEAKADKSLEPDVTVLDRPKSASLNPHRGDIPLFKGRPPSREKQTTADAIPGQVNGTTAGESQVALNVV